jgi:hypothetical protein
MEGTRRLLSVRDMYDLCRGGKGNITKSFNVQTLVVSNVTLIKSWHWEAMNWDYFQPKLEVLQELEASSRHC